MLDLQTFVCSLGSSITVAYAIVKVLVRSESRVELKEDIQKLHDRANIIEKEFVRCEFCKLQHDTLTANLTSMDKKLDILIEKR